jgi:hypothetical protein
MKGTHEQPAEALELINEIQRGMIEAQSLIDEIMVTVERMQKSADRMLARRSEPAYLNSPSICPTLDL